jgi:hypothetical protein
MGLGPVSLAGAVVNSGSLANGAPDINQEKTYIGQVGFGQDEFSAAATVLFGADGIAGPPNFSPAAGDNGQQYGLLDVVLGFDADAFQAWLNADYLWVEGSAAQAWGIAIAGRVPITDMLSAAARLEYARDESCNSAGCATAPAGVFAFAGPRGSDVYSATGTLAYELAENLELKGEIRWDKVNESNTPDAFTSRTAGGHSNQVVGLAQMVYSF